MKQLWTGALAFAHGDGPSLSNSTTPTSILPAADKFTLRANTMEVGRKLSLKAFGRFSNIATTPGTGQFDLKIGAVAVWSSGAFNFSTTVHTTLPWWLELELRCAAIGSAANFMGLGKLISQCVSATSAADNASTHPTLLLPNSAPAVGSNVDLTADNVVDLYFTFSTANAGNLIQSHDYCLTSPN